MGLRVARRPRIPSLSVWTTGPTIAKGVSAAMLPLFKKDRMWRTRELKPSYDVVIVGAGVHGLATAYYLGSQHNIRRVALLEKGYLGSGNSGRNTAIIRSNYRTPEGIPFYQASVKLYEDLSRELGWNMLFSQYGHLTLAHTDSAVNGLRVRAENNQVLGVDSRMISPDEIRRLVPAMDLSNRARFPVLAALYHPPGGIIRHDAVVWGY
ncbi:MAG: sarcosine oxidase subunit beta, partial [Acidobacteria bacterium]